MEMDTVLYEKKEGVSIITLNRPHRLNAINGSLLDYFTWALVDAMKDKETKTVILMGAGKSFCAGEDLKEISEGKSFEQWIEEVDKLQDIQRLMLRMNKPIIAVVKGYAVGGGCEFALACDIRIAGGSAKFGFPETGVGLTVTQAGTKLLSQIVSLGKAKELIFTGDIIDVHEAFRWRMVNRVTSDENVMDEAMAMCKKIGEKSALSLRLSRCALDQGMHSSFEQILEMETAHLLVCGGSQNEKEFVDKRLEEMRRKKK